MLIFSILFIWFSNAVTSRRDISILFSRVAIIVLLYTSYLAFLSSFFNCSFPSIALYGGLFHATSISQVFHMLIFLISAIILQLTTVYYIRIIIFTEDLLKRNKNFFDIYRAIYTTKVIFRPLNILKYFVYLVFVGIMSDLFIRLPHDVQMSFFIILSGIVVEIIDNKNLKFKPIIKGVIKNKTYFFTVFIFRLLGFYLIINFLVFILPLDIYFINVYILPYLQVSLVKKLLLYSLLGELFTGIVEVIFSIGISFNLIGVAKCDSLSDWDNFVKANPTVIMPHKWESLSVLAPEVLKTKSLLWYTVNNQDWNPYYWNSYHPNKLTVYGYKGFSAPHVVIDAHPLPKCEGLYWRIADRSRNNQITFQPVDTSNFISTRRPLYAKTSDGEYILTPFKVQPLIKKIRN